MKRCIDCHFFVHTLQGGMGHKSSIKIPYREGAKNKDFDWFTNPSHILYPSCYFGVWDASNEKVDPSQELLKINRKDNCFFWPHVPKLQLPAAEKLQERYDRYRKEKRGRRHTIVGIWIAIFGIFLNAVIQLIINWSKIKQFFLIP